MRYELNSDLMIKAAREYGRANGWKGNGGGWISNGLDTVRVQGWWLFFRTHSPMILDWYTRKLTAFDTFNELLGTHPNYRPTILPRDWRHVLLADAYDWRMARRGDSRRAWRGTNA